MAAQLNWMGVACSQAEPFRHLPALPSWRRPMHAREIGCSSEAKRLIDAMQPACPRFAKGRSVGAMFPRAGQKEAMTKLSRPALAMRP